MSSHKHFALACCLFCAALPARAEKPNDNRSADNDKGSSGALQRSNDGYTKEWGGKSIHEWIRDLKHPDPTSRVEAMLAIPHFKQAADAVPAVIDQLYKDGDASVRVKAAMLMRMVPHHKIHRTTAMSGLAHALRYDPQAIVRYEAAVALQSFCPLDYSEKKERDVLQDLVAGLGQSTTYELREACVVTLIMAGIDPNSGPEPRVTDALIARANPMSEAATRVRVKAIMALGAQGRPHEQQKFDRVMGVLKMQANFQSRNPTVRIWAHVAVIALELEKKDHKKELDTIAEYLNNREAVVRREAVSALGALEDRSQGYVDDILKLLKAPNEVPAVKAEAATALGRIKNTGPRVINALIRLTEEDKPESFPIVWNACYAFVLLGVNNRDVMGALDKVLEHKSLQEYQRMAFKKLIEEIQNPRKKPAKEAPKGPEKGVAPVKNNRR